MPIRSAATCEGAAESVGAGVDFGRAIEPESAPQAGRNAAEIV